jgi:hypothetical protein
MLLQVLDEGSLTDSLGRKVDFKWRWIWNWIDEVTRKKEY